MMRLQTPAFVLVLMVTGTVVSTARGGNAPGSPTEQATFFENKVRPVLADKCFSCHGEKLQMSGLRLDSIGAIEKGGSRGRAIVPGKPDASVLIGAIRYDGKLKMPPTGKLTDALIADLTTWVKMGAPWPEGAAKTSGDPRNFWSFLPLRRPMVPAFKTASWVTTQVDAFILEAMEKGGVKPNPYADRRTLIRRASFDLTGLPPTPEEVESFVNDTSPQAWSKVIDRLLSSPHYGERWGRHWLDLARFAESHGYEQDYDRPYAYHYRDFVIKALNMDLPYDVFVKWQIAGDEFEPENPLALMATGFLAAGTHATQITKNQVEKERYDELDDMLSTTCTSMLALTAGCARCHNHKFDPISNNDYYRMLSTFTTTVRSEMDINTDPEGYRLAKTRFDAEHAPYVEAVRKFEKDRLPDQLQKWLDGRTTTNDQITWLTPEFSSAVSQGGAQLEALHDGSYRATGPNPENDTYVFTARTQLKSIKSIRLEALADPSLVKGGPGRASNGNFALSNLQVTASPINPEPSENGKPAEPVPVKLVSARATFEQQGLPVQAVIDADKKSAWAVDPQFGKDHAAVVGLESPIGFDEGTILTFTLEFKGNTGHNIGRVRLSVSDSGDAVTDLTSTPRPESVQRILNSLKETACTDRDRATLLEWYRTIDAEWRTLHQREQDHLSQAPKPPLQKMLISSEGVPAVRTHTQGGDFLEHTHFLKRGDPNNKEAIATQGFMQVLMRAPDGEKHWQVAPPKDWRTSYQRRSFANWITDVNSGAGHLLARVIVNRLWQHHMGRGIVATPSDFGTQGEHPTHPELLDWLATELIRNGWKLKPIHRLIMTSATYMQSASTNPVFEKIDPQNRLCWHFPRKRIEAEIIRDSMLAVSGLLDATMFGPGTLDENHKRRSIYFFIKRSKLIPTMTLFDAPNALTPIPVRPTTTIAPQALMLLNNAHVRECARSLAKRIKRGDSSDSVSRAYLVTLSRYPTNQEKSDAVVFLSEQSRSYRESGNIKESEELALADFCQVLMSLNEFVYVE